MIMKVNLLLVTFGFQTIHDISSILILLSSEII